MLTVWQQDAFLVAHVLTVAVAATSILVYKRRHPTQGVHMSRD